jgi:cytochrome bd-type quinol oxidase subunit 2
MKTSFLPRTTKGRISLWLFLASVVFFIIFQALVITGQRGGDNLTDNLLLSVPVILAGFSAVSASIVGLISLIKSNERSIITFLITMFGLIVIIFLGGEILFPH